MSTPLPLRVAIACWRRGTPISLTLYATLMSLGFDVETLERKYSR